MGFCHQIITRNVNGALAKGLTLLSGPLGLAQPSRNGAVRAMAGPVVTTYQRPHERVLLSPLRDANPFFHLFESLWMLAGRNDLPWVVQFNQKFNIYSDDGGKTQPAAYGYRWLKYFGYDQLEIVVQELARDPNSRRAVLAMWDGGAHDMTKAGDCFREGDLSRALNSSADIPCNTHCYFRVADGALEMAVMCRSNDIVWGAYGANAVHFSVLMEYIAARLGLAMGTMYQFSFNYHYYEEIVGSDDRARAMSKDAEENDHYPAGMSVTPMFMEPKRFMAELPDFMRYAGPEYYHGEQTMPAFDEPFLDTVAVPMRKAWGWHKRKDYGHALQECQNIRAQDWRTACTAWVQRRAEKHNG